MKTFPVCALGRKEVVVHDKAPHTPKPQYDLIASGPLYGQAGREKSDAWIEGEGCSCSSAGQPASQRWWEKVHCRERGAMRRTQEALSGVVRQDALALLLVVCVPFRGETSPAGAK